jgi:hypothetical protein
MKQNKFCTNLQQEVPLLPIFFEEFCVNLTPVKISKKIFNQYVVFIEKGTDFQLHLDFAFLIQRCTQW